MLVRSLELVVALDQLVAWKFEFSPFKLMLFISCVVIEPDLAKIFDFLTIMTKFEKHISVVHRQESYYIV